MCKIETIDNRNIGAVYHAGDLNQLITRASVIRASMNQIAKRNRDTFHSGARTVKEYRIDPSDDDYNEQCDKYVQQFKRAFKKMQHFNKYRAAVIIINNYAIELLVADE